jgi:hypothetical protein
VFAFGNSYKNPRLFKRSIRPDITTCHAKHHAESLREESVRTYVFAVIAALIPLPAAADEPTIVLKKADGVEKVEANCQACHSLDYIPMNAQFLSAASWNAEVTKMIKAFVAPIDNDDAKAIAD